ncbi:hemolysin family protein [Dokdonella sp.]|uniref:hemolysin family protein n=1 Tax=Dokdonella sp. TaxID=2291710 RepID=UPI00262D9708|nr:hemolysin family protein [Dokdonella sp.]
MLQNLLYVAAALLLVLLNGFFVAAEFALVKLRHTQAATLGDSHGWRGRVLINVHSHLDAYLSACQLGITLASLALGWIGEPAFAHLLEPLLARMGASPETTQIVGLVIAFTLISYLHIVLGELAPKSLAIRRPEAMSLWTAAPLYAFYWLMYPAIWLLNASANWMLRRGGLGSGGHDDEHGYSRDELKLIVHAQRENRAGEEYSMMKYALDLPELVVGDVMRTRDQLAALREGMDRAAVLAEFGRTNYSRYPWFDTEGERVLGILHMKDLLHAMAERADVDDMRSLLRPPILLPLHTPVLDVLKRFRAGDTHLALGVEDSGRVAGFFTLEDILEVLVGDIEDEGDAEDELADTEEQAGDGLTISGGTPIYRLERLLDREIEAPADVNSVGGLIIHRLERLPVEGETLSFDGFDLTVRTMQGARAKTIVVHPHETLSEEPR